MNKISDLNSFKGAQWALGFAFFTRFVVFWLLLFVLQRAIFLVHYWSKFKEINYDEILKAFFFGLGLDLAMIGLLSLAFIPFCLTWMAFNGKNNKLTNWIIKAPLILSLLASIFVHSGEIAVYSEWGHKLTTRVFTHLVNPDEMYRSAKFLDVVWFLFYSAIQLVFAFFLIKISFKPLVEYLKENKIKKSFYPIQFFVFMPLAGLMARGGWQAIPISISDAMFSQSAIVNDLSINSTYYFFQSLAKNKDNTLDDLFAKDDAKLAEQIFQEIKDSCEDFDYFLDTIRPNIVFVVLESWTSDAISASGKIENTTPNFDRLIDEGLYFSNCYATSGTSEVGLSSIFSGYPGLINVSLPLSQEKSRKTKAINQTLKNYGYNSSFLFGGDLKYGNIGAYLYDHQFEDVKDEKHFKHIKTRGALNVYDTDLLEEFINQINQNKEPFMSVAFTGSTHSPWDIPEKWLSFYQGNEKGIINTIRFADHALGKFITLAKQQAWFENTIFIFVSDHGRTSPFNEHHFTPEFFKIPLLFWGKPIKEDFRGMKMNQIVSQIDIVATLLSQMKISHAEFKYSRNQMCPQNFPFAMYSSTLGFGGISPQCNFFYNLENGTYFTNSCYLLESNNFIDGVRGYFKTVWEDFKAL